MGRAQRLAGAVPDAYRAPVIVLRDVHGPDIVLDLAAPAIDRAPVGMADQHGARIDHLADGGNVAQARIAVGAEGHDRADLWLVTTGIAPFGLVPPGMGIAIDPDARHLARIGHALQVGGQVIHRRTAGIAVIDIDGAGVDRAGGQGKQQRGGKKRTERNHDRVLADYG